MEPDDHTHDFDAEDEAATARFKAAEERLRNTPPRCLNEFKVERVELNNVAFDGHGSSLNKIFKLTCTCGHDHFHALGHLLTNDRGQPIFVSPLALQCARCQKTTELFDSAKHGYDAELGYRSATIRRDGPRTPFACDKCGVQPMLAYVRFEHGGEELADSFIESHPETENYFSWFTLAGKCDKCERMLQVANFECA